VRKRPGPAFSHSQKDYVFFHSLKSVHCWYLHIHKRIIFMKHLRCIWKSSRISWNTLTKCLLHQYCLQVGRTSQNSNINNPSALLTIRVDCDLTTRHKPGRKTSLFTILHNPLAYPTKIMLWAVDTRSMSSASHILEFILNEFSKAMQYPKT
jgi:hypothetical protein